MRSEDYTADAICRAMNLPGFVEPAWVQNESPTLRVVLRPSFHPELCITLFRAPDAARLSVVALTEQLWFQRSLVRLPTEREEVDMAAPNFEEVLNLFATAYGKYGPQQRCIFIDGMGSDLCLASRTATLRLASHVSAGSEVEALLTRLIALAWNACRQPQVRNALAQAAAYLDVKYPLQEVPPRPTVTRIAILGTPQERQEYFEMLRRSKERKSKIPKSTSDA